MHNGVCSPQVVTSAQVFSEIPVASLQSKTDDMERVSDGKGVGKELLLNDKCLGEAKATSGSTRNR